MWYFGEGICLKLTHKSLKRGQREPVSPVVDTEDLYRRYLRIRAEREYFREHDSSDWNIRELEKKTFFLPWQLNICTNHRDFRRGGAGAEVLVLLPLNARIKFQIRPSFLFTACLVKISVNPKLPDYLLTKKISWVASDLVLYTWSLFLVREERVK